MGYYKITLDIIQVTMTCMLRLKTLNKCNGFSSGNVPYKEIYVIPAAGPLHVHKRNHNN